LGYRIPEDIQIASLYDSEILAATTPPVSALHFSAADIGRAACRELLLYLKNEQYDPTPVLGYRIIKRESV
jgi:DNA-binding LacI/PurR family transcriptional regulator